MTCTIETFTISSQEIRRIVQEEKRIKSQELIRKKMSAENTNVYEAKELAKKKEEIPLKTRIKIWRIHNGNPKSFDFIKQATELPNFIHDKLYKQEYAMRRTRAIVSEKEKLKSVATITMAKEYFNIKKTIASAELVQKFVKHSLPKKKPPIDRLACLKRRVRQDDELFEIRKKIKKEDNVENLSAQSQSVGNLQVSFNCDLDALYKEIDEIKKHSDDHPKTIFQSEQEMKKELRKRRRMRFKEKRSGLKNAKSYIINKYFIHDENDLNTNPMFDGDSEETQLVNETSSYEECNYSILEEEKKENKLII